MSSEISYNKKKNGKSSIMFFTVVQQNYLKKWVISYQRKITRYD
jgi:hypothetical protein